MQPTRKKRFTKVISVTSGKGGVGKTQLVANLALAFRREGKEVLVLDGDMGLANIDILYHISPPYNLKHLLDGTRTIEQVLFEGPEGVKILPAASGLQELTTLNAQKKLYLTNQLDRLEGQFDIILIDTAAGISDNVMYLNSAAQIILVVVTSEPTSLTDAYALMKVAAQHYGEKIFYVVVNKVKNEAEGKNIFQSLVRAADQFLNSVQLWYLHTFLENENVKEAILRQIPMIQWDKSEETSKNFRQLAQKIDHLEINAQKGGMQFFLKQVVQQ